LFKIRHESHNSGLHSAARVCVADLENMYNCSCERALLNDSKSLRRHCNDHGHLSHFLPSSAGIAAHAQ